MSKIYYKRVLQDCLKEATIVLVQVRFGLSEQWIRISKKEARRLVRNAPDEPDEMFNGSFGSYESDRILYLG